MNDEMLNRAALGVLTGLVIGVFLIIKACVSSLKDKVKSKIQNKTDETIQRNNMSGQNMKKSLKPEWERKNVTILPYIPLYNTRIYIINTDSYIL